jgi:hypothetical protein
MRNTKYNYGAMKYPVSQILKGKFLQTSKPTVKFYIKGNDTDV